MRGKIEVDTLDFLSNFVDMTKSAIDWDLIDALATKHGVSYWARRKWRQRNHVPHKWRWGIILDSNGMISVKHFDRMDRARGKEIA
jgi:hypothetical protein